MLLDGIEEILPSSRTPGGPICLLWSQTSARALKRAHFRLCRPGVDNFFHDRFEIRSVAGDKL
jgi:hypothetical protein